ncbi:hypothetical protein HMPREF1869_00436 [Bacteroidales bacterium KA00251]|nr:hypothetical protein HMPREF1869_00436 [Bacteroidales bacterium KA00251]
MNVLSMATAFHHIQDLGNLFGFAITPTQTVEKAVTCRLYRKKRQTTLFFCTFVESDR